MDRKLKFILILFPVILVSAYIYGLTWDPFENDVLGSLITNQLFSNSDRTIICPEGYMEGYIETFGGVDITLSEPIESCFSLTIHDPSHPDYVIVCGDIFLNTEGNMESVECRGTQP